MLRTTDISLRCAHDDEERWGRMIANLRRAQREVGRPCRVLMDLGGPRLRTGAIEPLEGVIRWRPQRDSFGVMIARGDLAVECGYERLAEVQEEILWLGEAAHAPVIWATQVLETLAKNGIPSRAEITDAEMGERAECVMLNKGPHIVDAVRVLDNILRRMQSHQSKKRSLLRRLHWWSKARTSSRTCPGGKKSSEEGVCP
jgi:pyruvate kinase